MMITPKHAAALRSYRYAGQDRSILYHYVLSPWAQLLVDVATPPWLAPNAITFLGLLPPVLTLVIALQAQPELGQGMAGWVALLCAASMFVYSTLDNMDGKQARKTGSSSALGLLFDHGCDAVNAGLVNWANIALIVGVSAGSFQTLYWFIIPVVPFFFATWEERHMGVFILPLVNGPNEGIFLCISLMVAQFLYGERGQQVVWHSLWTPQGQGGGGAAGLALRAALWATAPLLDLGAALQRLGEGASSASAAAALLQCTSSSSASASASSYLAAWAGALPWVWGAEAGCAVGAARSGDVILCLVLWGALLTGVYNSARVCAHAWRGARSAASGAAAVAAAAGEVAVLLAILAALGAWLFHPALHALARSHWVLVFGAAGCLFVELSVRHMLAHVCGDDALLHSASLYARIAAFGALPVAVLPYLGGWGRGGEGGAAAVEAVEAYARPALLLAVAGAVLPALHLVLTACVECARALGIDVFSIAKRSGGGGGGGGKAGAAAAEGARGGAGAPPAAAALKKRRSSSRGS